MLSHPLSLIGYCVTVGGWIWLVSGSSSDVGLGSPIINIHGTALALGTIMTGIGVSLAGLIVGGLEHLREPQAVRAPKKTPPIDDIPAQFRD